MSHDTASFLQGSINRWSSSKPVHFATYCTMLVYKPSHSSFKPGTAVSFPNLRCLGRACVRSNNIWVRVFCLCPCELQSILRVKFPHAMHSKRADMQCDDCTLMMLMFSGVREGGRESANSDSHPTHAVLCNLVIWLKIENVHMHILGLCLRPIRDWTSHLKKTGNKKKLLTSLNFREIWPFCKSCIYLFIMFMHWKKYHWNDFQYCNVLWFILHTVQWKETCSQVMSGFGYAQKGFTLKWHKKIHIIYQFIF